MGGITIPVAISSPSWSRMDAADVGRVFDNTLFVSQAGGAAREWDFETPPVTTALADSYIAVLGSRAAKLCSGDILQLPTMCSPELPGGTPVRKSVGHNVVLKFRLLEINPAKILLKYAPGDTITGESFTRSTIGHQTDASSVLVSKAINVKRDGHYISAVRSILMEDARINRLLHASAFDNAAWTKSNMTVGTGIADPAGGTAACTLTATGSGAFVEQSLAAGSSIIRTNSVYLRRRTGTGVIQIRSPSGPVVGVTLTSSWQRFPAVGTASTIRDASIVIATSGDAVDAYGYQLEDGASATSFFPTTTGAGTREDDSYSMPFTPPPGELTIYIKFVELGTALTSGARVLEIASAADVSPRFILQSQPTVYGTYHGNATSFVTSLLAAGPALNDVVELSARLFGDGSTDLTQSLNGAAATSSVQSAANPFATAWSGPLLWLNSAGTAGSEGLIAIQSLKIVAGSRSLDEMRAA